MTLNDLPNLERRAVRMGMRTVHDEKACRELINI